ncbi:MAG: hypothetical protein WKF43_03325 [Acidimicrobiales bacterium]
MTPGRRPGLLMPAALLTLALAFSVAVGEPERAVAVRIWFVAVGALLVRVLVVAIGPARIARRRDAFDAMAAGPGPAPPRVPPGLKAAARLVELGSGTAADLHFRLRPVLREVAAQRLSAAHGLDLDDPRDAPAAADRCGPVLWDLVRSGRPTPADRGAPALPPAVVADVVRRLESL